MPYVCFDISTEKKIDSIIEDNMFEITGHFSRGHYEDVENAITHETINIFIRDERFENNVTIVFLPDVETREEALKEMYNLLLETKNTNDEVIPECVYAI